MPSASPAWRSGIARAMLDAFIALALEKTPRALRAAGRQPGGAVRCGPARGRARLGARLPGRDPEGCLGRRRRHRADRLGRARRACGWAARQAIHRRVEVADWVYKAAGTSAIFLGTPFERRFRDIHTLSQQIQSREAHFEAVGQVMLNGDPDGTFM